MKITSTHTHTVTGWSEGRHARKISRDGRNVGGTSEEEGRRRNVGGGGRRFFELGDGGTSEEVDETDEGLGENELQIDGKVWQIKCVR